MSTIWKTIKVFISSTFLDMELERDRLAQIFYQIEKSLLERQLAIVPYDLRWRDRLSSDPIVDWCLKMVEQCSYFIGILGNRYGWCPPTGRSGQDNSGNISITEMEINTALAQIAPEKRFFCFAESSTTDATTSQADLDALASLKQRLIQAGETIHRYQQVDELLAIIEREMRQRLDRAYPPGRKVTPTHYSYHQAAQEIIEEKIRQFVDRVSYLQQLEDFVRDDGRPNYLGIHAVAGTGKSALVANFIKNWTNPDIPIVAHFMTMGGDSQEVNGIMANLGEQLHQLGIIDAALAADPLQLRGELANALHRCGRRLIMIIDALDEIYENGRDLSWLPCSLPPQVRMIITTRPGDSWQRLQRFLISAS